MATTSIELDIENITGVSDADDQFIVSAQKFIVSSVPKNLLKWASTETTAGTHGGDASPTAITLPVGTDNIISVRRGDYVAYEVPIEDRAFIGDSGSLKLATSKYPKYWKDANNKVQVKPAPTDSVTAHVEYIDFSQLDDDSDLRNAVIFHACAKEFTKLSSDTMPDWSDVSVPIAPASPDFGSDLSINAVVPTAPSDPSFDTGAISISASAPAYTKPNISVPTLGSVGSLDLPVSPIVPSISTVNYTDAINADASASSIGAITVASVNKADISGNTPTYTKPTITTRVSFDTFFDGSTNSFGDSDPGIFSVVVIPPSVPSLTTVSYADVTNDDVSGVGTIIPITVSSVNKADISGDVPTYTKPSTAIAAVAPSVPSLSTVSFTDPGLNSLAVEPSTVSLTTVNYSDANQTSVSSFSHPVFTAPTLDDFTSFEDFFNTSEDGNPFGDNDPGDFTITAVPPALPIDPAISYIGTTVGDAVSAAQDSIAGAVDGITTSPTDASGTSIAEAPTDAAAVKSASYTKPTVNGDGNELTDISQLDDEDTIDVLGDQGEVDQWWSTLGHLIEDEEDVELANAQIQKIRAYIDAFQAEIQSNSADMQADIENAKLQVQASIANASNDVSSKNAAMQTLIQASVANAANDTQASVSKMNNSTQAATTKMVQSTQAAIQKMQLSTNVNIQNAAKTLEALMQDYRLTLQKYEADLSRYQADIQKEISQYSNKMARYQLEVGTAYTAWVETQNDRIKKYQANLTANQIDYQRQEAIMQTDLQKALTDATEANKIALTNNKEQARDAIENNNVAIAKYQAEAQVYSNQIQKDIQSYNANLEAASQSMQSTIQDNQNKLGKYGNEIKAFDSDIQKQIATIQADLQNELNEFNKENVRYQANVQAELAKHQSDLQKVLTQAQLDAQDAQQEAALAVDIAKFNKAQDQALGLANAAKQIEDVIADNNNKIQKYNSELTSYQAEVQSQVQEYSQKVARYQAEIAIVMEAWSKTESDTLQQYQLDIQNELNEFNKENAIYQANIQAELAKHQSDLQKVITQAQLDAQDAQQEASLATDIEKFNKAQDQALAIENATKQMEDIIADNNVKIQKYSAELQSYQMQVASAVQKWTAEEWNQNFLKYQTDYQSKIQTFQADIQNELNEFNKEQTVFQNELQEKIQEATNQQTKDAQEYSSKLQKYANQLQAYQADVNKEVQDYTNTLTKEFQEYQNKVALYTADLQKYQAEVVSETQKTTLNSQKAQLYEAEANKYYQWAVAEVQTYVQNNSQMIGMQMAAQAAQK